MEKYSVLMSVYYKEKPEYLKDSINSMINQTVMPDEIIIIEDGPLTDELNNVIEFFKNKYSGLFVIEKLEHNVGLGAALNVGIKISKNELIARMDTDDIALPERCEKQLKAFEKNDKIDIIGTQIEEFIDTPDNVVSSRIVPLDYEGILKFSRRRSPFNHPTVMYKKSKVLDIGGYQPYGRKEDLDLFIKMVHNGYAINLEEALLLYRTNNDNLKRRTTWTNCSEYIKIMFKFYRLGYSSTIDMIYVLLGQLSMYLMPKKITAILSNSFLRSKKI